MCYEAIDLSLLLQIDGSNCMMEGQVVWGGIDMDKETNKDMQASAVLIPGVSSSYGHGWRQLWKYFLELFLIGLIGFLIGLPTGLIGRSEDGSVAGVFFGILGLAYGILVNGPIDYGVSFAYLKASRGDKLEIKDVFAMLTRTPGLFRKKKGRNVGLDRWNVGN